MGKTLSWPTIIPHHNTSLHPKSMSTSWSPLDKKSLRKHASYFLIMCLKFMLDWLMARFCFIATHYVSSPTLHVPDVPSPLYPDRLIRPLPKRRIRSRLTPDLADAILYSALHPGSSSLFYYPYTYPEPERGSTHRNRSAVVEHNSACACASHLEHPPLEGELDSDEEELSTRTRQLYPTHQDYIAQLLDRPHSPVNPPDSANSSVDGYDSFENTKNKKKRKIPTPATTSAQHIHLSTDLANLRISSRHATEVPSSDQPRPISSSHMTVPYPTASVGPNRSALSGSGSGRLSRVTWRNGNSKSPLGVSSDGTNAWSNGRADRFRPKDWPSGGGPAVASPNVSGSLEPPSVPRSSGATMSQKCDAGIIAAAIANATQKVANVGSKDQENFSWFHQYRSRKPTAQNAQFTFTAASNVAWPGGAGIGSNGNIPGSAIPAVVGSTRKVMPVASHLAREMATQGAQTSLQYAGVGRSIHSPVQQSFIATSSKQALQQQQHQRPTGSQTPQQQQHQQPVQPARQAAVQPAKKARSRPGGNQYNLAARERRLQQRRKNYRHPPSGDDFWICEFCEYESIFGSPPEALVRQYEIKDLKERRRAAEKRRLLEKAKMKGRKGKKAGKGAAKNATAGNPNSQQAQQTQQHAADQDGQSDDYVQDEFFDGEEEAPFASPPLPAPAIHPSVNVDQLGYSQPGLHPKSGELRGGGKPVKAN